MPQKETLDRAAYTCMLVLVSYRRLPPQFQFSLSGVTLVYCISMGMPQKDTLDRAAYTCMLVSYRRLSPQFQFSLSGVTLVYLSQWFQQLDDRGLRENLF